MEDEKVKFLSAMLAHMARSVHLPASLIRDISEGKVSGFSGVGGVSLDEDYNFTVNLPDTEQKLEALSKLMTVYYKYLSVTYDDIIAMKRLLQPAMAFVERNKEKVESLGIAKYLPTNLDQASVAAGKDGWASPAKGAGNLLSSGVQGFDELVGGGLPMVGSFLLQGPTGPELEVFANHFIMQGLNDGQSVLVIVSDQFPKELRTSLGDLGVAQEEVDNGKNLNVIDWYSYKFERVTGIEENGSTIKVSKEITNVSIAINKAMRLMPKTGPKRAVVKILSSAIKDFPLENVLGFVETTRTKFKNNQISALFVMDKEAHSQGVLQSFQKVFDGVIDIDRQKIADKEVPAVAVLSMAGQPGKSQYCPLTTLEDDRLGIGSPGKIPDSPFKGKPVKAPGQKAAVKPKKKIVKSEASTAEAPKTKVPSAPAPVPAKSKSEVKETRAGDILKKLRSTSEPSAPVHKVEKVDRPTKVSAPTSVPTPRVRQKDDTGPLFVEAAEHSRNGHRADAIKTYDRILDIDPQAREALTRKAVLLQLEGKHPQAVDCYDRALKIEADDSEAWSNRGISLRAMGKTEQAIASYDEALKVDPRDAGVWSNRGIALRTIGRNDEAIESYDKALEINPQDASVWSNRGVLLTMLKRYKDALYSFDQALAADPNYEKARKNRAILLEKMK